MTTLRCTACLLKALRVKALAPIAARHSESVPGTLNPFAWLTERSLRDGLARDARTPTRLLLDEIVLEPRHIRRPADRVLEAFGGSSPSTTRLQ